MTKKYLDDTGLGTFTTKFKAWVNNLLGNKQDTLVSGTNIKTVNNTSLLGSGNVAVQPTLVSGTNIKTVNNTSLLGSGNVDISGGAIVVEIPFNTTTTWTSTASWAELVAAVKSGMPIVVKTSWNGVYLEGVTSGVCDDGAAYISLACVVGFGASYTSTSAYHFFLYSDGTASIMDKRITTQKILYGTTAPTTSTGVNGDIFVVYEE